MFPEYRNESQQQAPKTWQEAMQLSAAQLQQLAQHNIGVIWRGDYHQAKQLLSAFKKRIRKPAKTGATAAETFHKYRLAQSQQSRLINHLCVEIAPNFQLHLTRAPDVQAALTDVFGIPNSEPFLLPLNQLLGYIGAHEWHKQGVLITALNAKIHVPFGVFSPLRGEYLDLFAHATLPENTHTAFDVGTGSGVLAAILARRGIAHIVATDTNPRAIATAKANLKKLGLQKHVSVIEQDLLPQGSADLIVCNPPWLPAKPTSAIETALYDPQHAMLHALLAEAKNHLHAGGQLWLLMSDLAEHLEIREKNQLIQWFNDYSYRIINTLTTTPQHAKAHNPQDPLAFARTKEIITLYQLAV